MNAIHIDDGFAYTQFRRHYEWGFVCWVEKFTHSLPNQLNQLAAEFFSWKKVMTVNVRRFLRCMLCTTTWKIQHDFHQYRASHGIFAFMIILWFRLFLLPFAYACLIRLICIECQHIPLPIQIHFHPACSQTIFVSKSEEKRISIELRAVKMSL